MEYKIIGDSCCDFNREQLEDRLHFQSVPLQLEIGDYHIADDAQFHQKIFLGECVPPVLEQKRLVPLLRNLNWQ